jgi:hypothetical protein
MLTVNNLTGFGGRGALQLSYLTYAVSNSSTITIPASVAVGYLAVLFDHAYDRDTTPPIDAVIPTTVVPSGWTSIKNTTADSSTTKSRGISSYRIIQSGDAGSSITGMNDNGEDKVMLIFAASRPIVSVTPSTWNGQGTDGNPSSQSVLATAATAPLIVIGASGGYSGTFSFTTASPSFDGTQATADNDAIMGYKIYNGSPADHTIDIGDNGDTNILQSGYLVVS